MKSPQDHDFEMSAPLFYDQSEALRKILRELPADQLQKIYACSDRTFAPVWKQISLEKQGVRAPLSPALLSYDGIAFRNIAPNVFDQGQWDYINNHLIVLSGLYGLLRPLDGISPYRLEMAQKLPFSLYEFWGSSLADAIEDDVIVSLASREYSDVIEACRPLIHVRFFEEDENGKRREKGVYAKIARGAMVRWMAENRVEDPADLRLFHEKGYSYDADASNDRLFVFVRKESKER